MEKRHSPADGPGYICAYEIRGTGYSPTPSHQRILKEVASDTKTPDVIALKVSYTVNLRRMDRVGKQCHSMGQQVLRGLWPDDDCTMDVDGSSVKGRRLAGETKAPYCRRLERLIHLELADLSIYAQYLDPQFPKVTQPETNSSSTSPSVNSSLSKSATSIISFRKSQTQPCADCTLKLFGVPERFDPCIFELRWRGA